MVIHQFISKTAKLWWDPNKVTQNMWGTLPCALDGYPRRAVKQENGDFEPP